MKKPEVLAPAGDRAAMEAAVRAGADAVYFGLQGFNARARATNFDVAELRATLGWLHDHGVKGYVTLNTLVFDAELEAVENAVRACADAGVDAVIVQDLGVAKLAHAIAPALPIHASTQMTCTDASSAELAKELGASRVILARELSLDDIAKIRASAPDVEVEVFVHGALCISYSGQCLTSEAIGGRSANRGACAQACRLPYELVVDGEQVATGDNAYLLSPEDLEASAVVPELVKLGVSSLKIEGRLKGPEYVSATTRLYRKAVDGDGGASQQERADALQTFTRGSGPGFFPGVDHQRLVEGRSCDHRGLEVGVLEAVERSRGKTWLVVDQLRDLATGDGILVEGGHASEGEVGGRVWAIEGDRVWLGPDVRIDELPAGRRVHKTSAPTIEKRIRERDAGEKKTALTLRIAGAIGEPFILEGNSARGAYARVTGDAAIELARSQPLDQAALEDKLGRLGDSAYVLATLTVDLPAGTIIPVSALNRARRALVSALDEAKPAQARHETTNVHYTDLVSAAAAPSTPPSAGLFVLCRTLAQATAALDAGAAGVYLDFLELTGTGDAVRELRKRAQTPFIGIAPPRIRKPGEEKIDRFIASLMPDAVLVRGLGALREVESMQRAASTAGGWGASPKSKSGAEGATVAGGWGASPKSKSGAEGATVAGGWGASPKFIGDFSLNVTNRVTAAEVLGRGLAAFTPSFDLDAGQLALMAATSFGPFMEVVLHHPMALFHMEHCVIAALLSDGKDYKTCGRPCEKHRVSLRDRAGMDHPVEADVGCRNTVFHAKPQSAVTLVPELARSGVGRYRIELVRESAAEVGRLVDVYRRALEEPAKAQAIWRELRGGGESGYGVVKGSLRVIP